MPDPITREGLLDALEHERAAILDLLPRFGDEQWRDVTRADGWTVHDIAMHLADSNYGLALMVLGELPVTLQRDERTGWMNVDDLNEQRRQKNAGLSREKAMSRLAASYEHARRAMQTIEDYDAPSPLGESFSKGRWLQRIVRHNQEHRRDFEQMLGSSA